MPSRPETASGIKSAWLISSGRLSSRSVRLAHRQTIAPSLYQIWPPAGTKLGSICDVSQGFLTALPRRPSMLCLLRSVSASLRRVAEPRPEVTARRCDTRLIPDRTAGLRCANDAACRPNQSRADAIIGRRESADFRGHPGAVTDAPGLGFCCCKNRSR